jgi:outer membrane protein assembly factor BamB
MNTRDCPPLCQPSGIFPVICAALLWASLLPASELWPEFRGPRGDGHADGSILPLRWSEIENVQWKVDIHGRGWSSPVIWHDQIWLTTATEDGKRMSAICVDAHTGQIVHDILVVENENPQFCHPTNSYASPTPIVEAGRVYVHFGSYGTACFDTTTGRRLWQRRDLPCDHWRGPGSSPILYDGRLYVAFDGYDLQYVVALDKQTGSTVWRRNRDIDYGTDDGDLKKAYCTCHVVTHAGRTQLICPSAAETISYDPVTGDEIWRVRHGGMNTATRPVYGGGLVYITAGDQVGETRSALLAIRPEGQGDITEHAIAWKLDKTPPKRPSPLLVDDLLFTINDEGIAMCLDSRTGDVIWRNRIAGNYRASPIYAAGRIYFANLEGDVTVIAADRQFQQLAVNHLEHGCQASPAVDGDAIILRTTARLYRIQAAARTR